MKGNLILHKIRFQVLPTISVILALAGVISVQASSTITVTTAADEWIPDGDCSLREAIRAANLDLAVDACPAGSGDDTILLPSGVYTLTLVGAGENDGLTGDLDINGNLKIVGAGSGMTVIGALAVDRVIHVPISSTVVTISGVMIRNGRAIDSFGGGIYNTGILTLTDSIVSSNLARFGGGLANGGFGTLTLIGSSVSGNVVTTTSFAGGAGGGIENIGTLVMYTSTVSGNVAEKSIGGGIHNQGQALLVNSTLSGNSSQKNGGAVFNVVGSFKPTDGTIDLNNVTIANNTTSAAGGGIYNCVGCSATDGIVNFKNTILAGNTGLSSDPDCSGPLNSQGHNLIQIVSVNCNLGGNTAGNLIGQNPKLGPLQDNGGSTLTHALLAGSPAVNAGDNAGCANRDQRGVMRPQGRVCDIGAFELEFPYNTFLPVVLKHQ